MQFENTPTQPPHPFLSLPNFPSQSVLHSPHSILISFLSFKAKYSKAIDEIMPSFYNQHAHARKIIIKALRRMDENHVIGNTMNSNL